MEDLTDYEVWKPLKEYEDTYVVNPYGYVKSLDRTITMKNGETRRYRSKTLKPKGASAFHALTRKGVTTRISGYSVVWDTFGHAPLDPRCEENWKPVRGYCGIYEVSDAMRVRQTVARTIVRGDDVVDESPGLVPIESGRVILDGGLEWVEVEVLDLFKAAFIGGSANTWDGNLDTLWRAIPDFPGYEMSASMKVRRVWTVDGIRHHSDLKVRNGYANLSRDGKRYRRALATVWERLFADILREDKRRRGMRT